MKKLFIKILLFTIMVFGISFLSCTTTADYIFETVSVEPKTPWQIDLTQMQTASFRMELTGPMPGYSRMTGEAFVEEGGTWLIHLDELECFHNHYNGWIEGSFELWGTMRLKPAGDGWQLEVLESPWIERVSSGKIRYKDTIISGERGREQLQRMFNRIEAMQEILHKRMTRNWYPSPDSGFEQDLKQIFFPELGGFPAGIIPSEDRSQYIRSEGVLWDLAYTKQLLPDEWQELRNSGTLYRDFEEALPIFQVLFNWDYLWQDELPNLHIKLIKE